MQTRVVLKITQPPKKLGGCPLRCAQCVTYRSNLFASPTRALKPADTYPSSIPSTFAPSQRRHFPPTLQVLYSPQAQGRTLLPLLGGTACPHTKEKIRTSNNIVIISRSAGEIVLAHWCHSSTGLSCVPLSGLVVRSCWMG